MKRRWINGATSVLVPAGIISFCCVLVSIPAVAGFSGKSASRFDALLHCDLIVRGRIQSVAIVSENVNDAMPMWPKTDPAATTPVAHVRMLVDEELRGSVPGDSLQFLVYISVSSFKYDYDPGQEMVVGLVWGPEVLGGMYYLFSDRGRFVRAPSGWLQQRGGALLANLDDLRRILNNERPLRVLADADAAVIGKVVSDSLTYRKGPEGQDYAVFNCRLADVDVVKGDWSAADHIVQAITSGDYWPAWREDPTYPAGIERGKRYCFFLRRFDEGFAILRGMSGAYEVQGEDLLVPGRKKIGLTLKEVRASVAEHE